jgi:hypothetical protein
MPPPESQRPGELAAPRAATMDWERSDAADDSATASLPQAPDLEQLHAELWRVSAALHCAPACYGSRAGA